MCGWKLSIQSTVCVRRFAGCVFVKEGNQTLAGAVRLASSERERSSHKRERNGVVEGSLVSEANRGKVRWCHNESVSQSSNPTTRQ